MHIPRPALLLGCLVLLPAALFAACSDAETPLASTVPAGTTVTPTAPGPEVPAGPSSPAAGTASVPANTPTTPTTPPAAPTTGSATPAEPVASTASIPTSELPLVRFISRTGAVELPVEVLPREEFAIGFSGRYEIEGRGMLFYYPELSGGGFWMRNTHVDLDIAFVNADLQVIFITTMLAETLDVHRPDAPYLAAIETPAGWYAEHGIDVGARVEFLFDPLAQGAP